MTERGYIIGFVLAAMSLIVNIGLWIFGTVGINSMLTSIAFPIILCVWLIARYKKYGAGNK